MEQPANTVWIPCYSADGFKLSFTVVINSVDDALALLDGIRKAGLSPREPGMVEGQEKELIAAVVRRQSSDGTPIIDFFPAWSHAGKFGAHKYAHLYLNTKEDIAEFEAQTGLRFNDLPLYESQTPLQRKFGAPPHRCEIAVKRSFEIVRTPDGQHDTGMPKYKYSYFSVPVKSSNGNGHHAPEWATLAVLKEAYEDVMSEIGNTELDKKEFVTLCGIKSAGNMEEWNLKFESRKHAVQYAVDAFKERLGKEKDADAKVTF